MEAETSEAGDDEYCVVACPPPPWRRKVEKSEGNNRAYTCNEKARMLIDRGSGYNSCWGPTNYLDNEHGICEDGLWTLV